MTNDSAALLLICDLYRDRAALREEVAALRQQRDEMKRGQMPASATPIVEIPHHGIVVPGRIGDERCGQPAPLAINGGGYVACNLDAGHDGPCCVTIYWK